MRKYEFDAPVLKHEGIDAAYIEFPYDVQKEFGVKGQVKVKAWFDGIPYRGSLAKMGHWCHLLGITREIRQMIGKNPGDVVHVILEQDLDERIVTPPEDFAQLLRQNTDASAFFEKLSYTHKKEYVEWIESAKKAETRQSRLIKAIEMLKKGTRSR
jgi:hypothetical protein